MSHFWQTCFNRLKQIKPQWLTLLALVAVFLLGYYWQHATLTKLSHQHARLQQSVYNLNQENQQLTRKTNILDVQLQVEKNATLDALIQLKQQKKQQAQLQEKLDFYQRVMAPELSEDGFVIEAFDITPAASKGFYHFDLVLLQQQKIKGVVKGNIDVQILGSMQGSPAKVALTDHLTNHNAPLGFSFKHFQSLTGQFSLPANFTPEQIQVDAEVFQYKRKKGDLRRVFQWKTSLFDD